MVEQNLQYAIVLAILGGMFQVLSVLILAYPEHLKQTRGKNFKKPMRKVLIPINVFVQLFNGAATTGAAIYGPVAIVMPVTVSSQLLFNILIFGYLQMEQFGKDVQVGTFIVVLGAVLLPVVGPGVQQDQNILELLTAPQAFAWTTFLFFGVSISGMLCYGCVNKKWEAESVRVYVTLAVARVFSSVLSASLSKTFALVSGLPLIIVILGFCICGIVLATSVVLQATKTEQKLFVPLISSATQIINAATGLILWEDWKVVNSWVGYAGVTIQIVVGVYLISSLDFFQNTADPNYALNQSVSLRNLYTYEERRQKIEKSRQISELSQHTDPEIANKTAHKEFFNDDSNRAGSSYMRASVSTKKRRTKQLSNMDRITSVRGLIGGITSELSVTYNQNDMEKTTEHNLTEEEKEEQASIKEEGKEIDSNKIMIRSLQLAEAAAKKGEERFVTPPKVFEMDSAAFGSIGSLSNSDDECYRCNQQ